MIQLRKGLAKPPVNIMRLYYVAQFDTTVDGNG